MSYGTFLIRQYDKVKWKRPVYVSVITDELRDAAEEAAKRLVSDGQMETGYYELVIIHRGKEFDSEIRVA